MNLGSLCLSIIHHPSRDNQGPNFCRIDDLLSISIGGNTPDL